MREYDDDIRPYVPVLQRLIVLIAVIVAVPVGLWTITAMVRTYILPPHAPNYQRIALLQSADSTADAAQPGPPQDITPPPAQLPPAPTSDQASLQPLPASTDQSTSDQPPALPMPEPAATPGSAQPLASTGSVMLPPQPATDSPAAAAPSDQAASSDVDNASPVVAPITGAVPLPRRRPNVVAMVMMANGAAAVPLPRARPAAAPEAAEPADNTPSMMQWAH